LSRVYESIIKVGATISKTFSRESLDAAKSLVKLSDATKKLQAAEKAAGAYKKLDAAVSAAKQKYDTAAAALRKLEDAEKAAGGATKESTQWRKAGARAVAAAAKELDRATAAAKKNADAMREAGVDVAKLAGSYDQLTRKVRAAERYEAARKRLFGERKDKDPTPLIAKAGEQFRSVGRDALYLAAAATGVGAAFAGLVGKALHAGDEIGDTAEKIGISAKALQELRYGAQQSGAEAETLDKALKKMQVTIGHFKNAKGKSGGAGGGLIPGLERLPDVTGEAAAAAEEQDPYKKIGLNAKKLALLKPEEQLKKIVGGLATLKTQADRAAVGVAIFGKSAQELEPFFKEGPAGIDKLSAAANRFGGVLDEKALAAADEADKALRNAKMAVGGLTNTLGAAFLPTATKVFTQFAEWVAKNRDQIKAWAETAAKWIENKAIPSIIKFGREFGAFAGKVIDGATKLANLVGGFDRLAIAVAALRLAPLAKTLAEIAAQGVKAAAALLKFAAANGAANGAGGAGGLLGGLGKLGAIGAAGAAGVAGGVALGNYALEKHDEYDQLLLKGMDAETERLKARRDAARRGRATPQVLGLWSALGVNPAAAAASGAGGMVFAPQINLGETPTREELGKKYDSAKPIVLDEWERAQRQRRRVSFGE
jgi:hypothetical protein